MSPPPPACKRADPIGELLHVRGERVAILAVAVGIFGDDVVLEGHQAEAVVAIVGGEILRELDDVLLDRVDIGLHRFGDIEDEHDIDRAALADAAKIENLGWLAILEDFDIVGSEIADRMAVVVGETEVESTPPSESKCSRPGFPVVIFRLASAAVTRNAKPNRSKSVNRQRRVFRFDDFIDGSSNSPDREGDQSSSMIDLTFK